MASRLPPSLPAASVGRSQDFAYLRNDRHQASATQHMAASETMRHVSSAGHGQGRKGAEDEDEKDAHNRFLRLRGALQVRRQRHNHR